MAKSIVSKSTMPIIIVGIIAIAALILQPGVSTSLSAGQQAEVTGPLETTEVNIYTGQNIKFALSAADGAGTAVNPTIYVYKDSLTNAASLEYWGDERSFSDDAGDYFRTASFSGGAYASTQDYTGGECLHYHVALASYEDAFVAKCLPSTGGVTLSTAQSTGLSLGTIEMKQFDTAAFASASVDMEVTTTETGLEKVKTITKTVGTNKVLSLTRMYVDDVNTSTEGIKKITVKITDSAGNKAEKVLYDSAGNVDATLVLGYYDSDYDTNTNFVNNLKNIRANSGEQITVEFRIKADTDSGAATTGDSLWQNNEVAVDGFKLYLGDSGAIFEVFGDENIIG